MEEPDPFVTVTHRRTRNAPAAMLHQSTTSPPALIATPAVAAPNIYENIIIEFVLPSATRGATAGPQHFYPKQKIQKILRSIWTTCPNAQIWSSIQHTSGITNMAELPSTPQSLEAFFYVALHVHPIGGLMGASLHFSLVTDKSVGIRSLLQTPDIQSFCHEENAYISQYRFSSLQTTIIRCLFDKVHEHIHRDAMTRNMKRALEFVDIFDEQGRTVRDDRPVPIYEIIPRMKRKQIQRQTFDTLLRSWQ
jgi:hypothetical protein